MYLTKGERLWLWGRRLGKSREQVALIYGVPPATISRWMLWAEDDGEIPEVALADPIRGWEMMAVARRRMKISITALAAEQGISHVTLIKREKGQGDWRASWDWWTGKIPPAIGSKRGKGRTGR